MAISSTSHLNKKLSISMDSSTLESSPVLSPSSEKRFWSELRDRVDTLLENRQLKDSKGRTLPNNADLPQQAPSLREDCLLLLRGFDSISASFSQFTSNLETALQGAKDLSKTSLIELVHSDSKNIQITEHEEEAEGNRKAMKRKCDSDQEDLEKKEEESGLKNGKLKKARNLAVSMATTATSLAKELKSIKSDLCFVQDRCALLEEENRRLREGCEKGIRHEEDDLVRLQMEALLAEKSRLANENANLTRENKSLQQLVEYHQLTSEDTWEDYEQVIEGMCLDFSSPISTNGGGELEAPQTPRTDLFEFSTSLDQCSSN